LRCCVNIPGPEVGFEMCSYRVGCKLVVVFPRFLNQEKDGECEGREGSGEQAREALRKRIKLSSAKLREFVAAGVAGVQECERVLL